VELHAERLARDNRSPAHPRGQLATDQLRLAVHLDQASHQSLSETIERGVSLDGIQWPDPKRLHISVEPSIDAIIVDPSHSPPHLTDLFFGVSREFGVPIVLFCAIKPSNVARLLRAMSSRPSLLIAADAEKPIATILDHVRKRRKSFATHILSGVALSLENAPPLLGVSIVNLFMAPELISVDKLARASAMSRRGLYRWCRKLGLAPPHRLVASAKLLRACQVLMSTADPIADAARAGGYVSNKTFLRHCISYTGYPASALRHHACSTELLERLGKAIIDTNTLGRELR
jgi:AraC-like DNA-binding protein